MLFKARGRTQQTVIPDAKPLSLKRSVFLRMLLISFAAVLVFYAMGMTINIIGIHNVRNDMQTALQTLERAIQKIDEEGRVPETEPEANAESKSRIELVQEYIASHLNEDLSLNRLSEVCHFHPVYLSRVFKEALGVTVGEYINLARLKKAKDLLVNSQMTVLEISREMGFTTDNYFCRWFRKSTGMSPHHYRDGNRN